MPYKYANDKIENARLKRKAQMASKGLEPFNEHQVVCNSCGKISSKFGSDKYKHESDCEYAT